MGRLLGDRSDARRCCGASRKTRAHLCQPRRAIRTGRQILVTLQLCHAAPDPRGRARPAGRGVCRSARIDKNHASPKTMKRPVVGVIANTHLIENRFTAHLVGENNLRAVADVTGALPMMFAGAPEITEIGALLEAVDGVLLTGGRANVHPSRFGIEPHPKHEPYDLRRDALALALVEVCVARGVPLLGICRGFQEMNVAFSGSLHPEIRELPGRVNHRCPDWRPAKSIRTTTSSLAIVTTCI